MISIGAVFRGSELKDSLADRLITTAMKAARECRDALVSGIHPAINVVFYFPGSLGSFDWDGLRDGKFSQKRQLLMVQVAVPSELVNSQTLKDFLVESLHAANQLAFDFFQRRGIDYSLAEADNLVQRIAQRMHSRLRSTPMGSG